MHARTAPMDYDYAHRDRRRPDDRYDDGAGVGEFQADVPRGGLARAPPRERDAYDQRVGHGAGPAYGGRPQPAPVEARHNPDPSRTTAGQRARIHELLQDPDFNPTHYGFTPGEYDFIIQEIRRMATNKVHYDLTGPNALYGIATLEEGGAIAAAQRTIMRRHLHDGEYKGVLKRFQRYRDYGDSVISGVVARLKARANLQLTEDALYWLLEDMLDNRYYNWRRLQRAMHGPPDDEAAPPLRAPVPAPAPALEPAPAAVPARRPIFGPEPPPLDDPVSVVAGPVEELPRITTSTEDTAFLASLDARPAPVAPSVPVARASSVALPPPPSTPVARMPSLVAPSVPAPALPPRASTPVARAASTALPPAAAIGLVDDGDDDDDLYSIPDSEPERLRAMEAEERALAEQRALEAEQRGRRPPSSRPGRGQRRAASESSDEAPLQVNRGKKGKANNGRPIPGRK